MSSLWENSVNFKNKFNKLNENLDCDVCIVGGGIFGITCAYYLSMQGFKVIVLEKDFIGSKTTGNTTAKITSQHGLFYDYLINSFGLKQANDYLYINNKAILEIKNIIDSEKIDCDFEFQDSFVYTTSKEDLEAFYNEEKALKTLNFNSSLLSSCSLPFDVECALKFPNQAQFNPLKYLYSLCDIIIENGGKIFCDTCCFDFKMQDQFNFAYCMNGNFVKSKYLIIASHFPFKNFPGFYFSKMYQSTSYAIAFETNEPLFNGYYINNTPPLFSYRTALYNGKRIGIIVGSDNKTGKMVSYDNTYGILESEIFKFYKDAKILFRWNTEDCISLDKLPYVGYYSSLLKNVFVATGFKKWGMTLSNVSANIICDMILGKENDYLYLFDSTRLKPIKNFDEVKNMTVDTTFSLVIDKLKTSNFEVSEIPEDSGKVIDIDGKKVGVYKDINSKLYFVNPICTHLGCLLSWNEVDKTWDCPCHGSRFDYMGKNLYGPGFKDLDRF